LSLVETSTSGHVATITLNRPELRNALSVEMCDAVVGSIRRLESDPGSRVVIVRGAGKVFCAGVDFAILAGPKALEFVPPFERMLQIISSTRLPVIAAIHGAALGGGLQLATACDFRIATTDASFGIPSSRLGVVVNFENVERLVVLIGIALTKEVLMTGRTLTATEARDAGLVTRTVGPARLDAEVSVLAEDVAGRAPLSVQGAKRAVQLVADHLSRVRKDSPAQAAEIDELVAAAYGSADLAEGIRAMADKRTPKFEGH
jgi:enoyl-CoA hydratase/carnithine racemase